MLDIRFNIYHYPAITTCGHNGHLFFVFLCVIFACLSTKIKKQELDMTAVAATISWLIY